MWVISRFLMPLYVIRTLFLQCQFIHFEQCINLHLLFFLSLPSLAVFRWASLPHLWHGWLQYNFIGWISRRLGEDILSIGWGQSPIFVSNIWSKRYQNITIFIRKQLWEFVDKICECFVNEEDGLIQKEELRAVLKACTEENGMQFSDKQLDQLTIALYEDARESLDHQNSRLGISYEELRAQMSKHPGLLENLSNRQLNFLFPHLKK